MPRFGTKSLLATFAIAALWLSTFSGFAAAQDVRKSILLLILVTFGFAALYARGRQRAFYSAYFIVMLVCGGLSFQQPLSRYTPEFAWQYSLGVSNALPPPPAYAPSYTSQPWVGNTSYTLPAPAAPQPVYVAPMTPYVLQAAPMAPSAMWIALGETIAAIWMFVLAALAGVLAAYISTQFGDSAKESR